MISPKPAQVVTEALPLYSARDLSPRYEAFSEEDD